MFLKFKKLTLAVLAATSMSAPVVPNFIQANSGSENAIITNLEDAQLEERCIEGPLTYVTVRATNLYYNSTTSVVNTRVPQNTYLTHGGGAIHNNRIFVVASGNRGGWANLSDLRLITCK